MNKLSRLLLTGVCFFLSVDGYSASQEAWGAFYTEVEEKCMKAADGQLSDPKFSFVDKYVGTAVIQGEHIAGGMPATYDCTYNKRTMQAYVTQRTQTLAPQPSGYEVERASSSSREQTLNESGFTTPHVASSYPKAWIYRDKPSFIVKPGGSAAGFTMQKDSSVTFAGKALFDKGVEALAAQLHLFSSPNGSSMIAIQRDWDYGGGRVALIDMQNSKVINHIITTSQVRGLGDGNIRRTASSLVWSPDSSYVALGVSFYSWEMYLSLIDVATGQLTEYRPEELKKTELPMVDLESIRWVDKGHIEVISDINWVPAPCDECRLNKGYKFTQLIPIKDMDSGEDTAYNPRDVLYSSVGDNENYRKYREVFSQTKVDEIVSSVENKKNVNIAVPALISFIYMYRDEFPLIPVPGILQLQSISRVVPKSVDDQSTLKMLESLVNAVAAENNISMEDMRIFNDARNINQKQIVKFDELNGTCWESLPEHKSAFHALGYDPKTIIKYVAVDPEAEGKSECAWEYDAPAELEYVFNSGQQEYVFQLREGKKVFVNDGVNTGTYNYSSDTGAHIVLDMVPWILWGTGAEDTLSREQRLRAAQAEIKPYLAAVIKSFASELATKSIETVEKAMTGQAGRRRKNKVNGRLYPI